MQPIPYEAVQSVLRQLSSSNDGIIRNHARGIIIRLATNTPCDNAASVEPMPSTDESVITPPIE